MDAHQFSPTNHRALMGGLSTSTGLVRARGGAAERRWLTALSCGLACYLIMGKGFAWMGIPPVFPGEILLLAGVLVFILSGFKLPIMGSPVTWAYLAFAGWGAWRTFPYLSEYKVDALRDAVIWAYGAFALLLASFLLRTRSLPRWIRQYAVFIPRWVVIMAFVAPLSLVGADHMPSWPWSEAPILLVKAGDLGVHLAGFAAFVLLGLNTSRRGGKSVRSGAALPLWFLLLGIVAALNRGGMLSVGVALGIVALFTSVKRWLPFLVAGVGIAIVLLIINPQIENPVSSRILSPAQVASNLLSVTGDDGEGDLERTKLWRLRWWAEIIDYTIGGQYFWTGKGYGINLAIDDGISDSSEEQLRSPHNGHLTILARSGVPGMALWLIFNGVFAGSLVRAYRRARRAGHQGWAHVCVWILAYWAAFLVNASFDVFLEGPQGGIPFWCLIGMGIATAEWQKRYANREHSESSRPPVTSGRSKALLTPAGARG
ncbi:MAG TPA: O-antigen ligase family protein [Terracidiphilus sp.]|nr:O-antigen ligase family protein [Terracidiphilus sp.]